MPELIIPKPAVAVATAALRARLPGTGYSGVYIDSDRPSDATGHAILPPHFILLSRAPGGGMINLVTDSARLLVECWASKEIGDGEQFANTARGILRASVGQRFAGGFIRCFDNDSGPTDFGDPLAPTHSRYQFLGDLLVSTN